MSWKGDVEDGDESPRVVVLEHYDVYIDAVAGFRRARPPIDSVVDLVSSVQQGKKRKKKSLEVTSKPRASVFLVVKGAYDDVLHEPSLDLLVNVGLGCHVCKWICSYLKDRTFCVQTEDDTTTQYCTCRGVPQGGVLSPTLFNLALHVFVDALARSVHLSIYAEDICLCVSGMTRLHIGSGFKERQSRITPL